MDILTKEERYKEQMRSVCELVYEFAQSKGWSPISRGRKAHVSIFGPVNGWNGIIDIELRREDWDVMPDSLQPETPMSLWCSATLERDGHRYHADTELFWEVDFAALEETVKEFLPRAWAMLTELNEADAMRDWPGPSKNPDRPPKFGPPRKLGDRI